MASYSENCIYNKFKEVENEWINLYKKNFINYRGKLKDNKNIPYTEYLSELILNSNYLSDLKLNEENYKSNRENYITLSHRNINPDNKEYSNTNRREEIFAKHLVINKLSHNKLGKFLDFQVPLKEKNEDNFGKIDLISYNSEEKTLYLVELKSAGNTETLLRAGLEIFTYSIIVDKNRLKKQLEEEHNITIEKIAIAVLLEEDYTIFNNIILNNVTKLNYNLAKANCNALNELQKYNQEISPLEAEYYTNLKKLFKEMEVSVFTY